MNTFDDLQIPFELFKAPIAHATVDREGECAECGCASDVRFHQPCYSCFRSGLSDSAIDTELGMVTPELADKGMTHGLPLGDPSEFSEYETTAYPIDPKFPNETWFQMHVSSTWLRELVRTPRHSTWQYDHLLFCCRRPMVFRGSLPADFLSCSRTGIEVQISRFLDQARWQDTFTAGHSSHTFYLFTCGVCGRVRYHDDCD
jgi:hypothetical protein